MISFFSLLSHEKWSKNNSHEEFSRSAFALMRDQSGENEKGNKKRL
jgi:hypothetical protein